MAGVFLWMLRNERKKAGTNWSLLFNMLAAITLSKDYLCLGSMQLLQLFQFVCQTVSQWTFWP